MPARAAMASAAFSSTVCSVKSCGSWKLRPMPRRTMARGDEADDRLAVIARSCRPAASGSRSIMLMKVVLPAPFGPMMARNSPGITSRSMPSAALTPPKASLRPRAERSASRHAAAPPQPAGQHSPEPARREEDDRQQHAAEDHLPGIGHGRRGIDPHQLEGRGAQEGTERAAGAAEDGDEDQLAGGRSSRRAAA